MVSRVSTRPTATHRADIGALRAVAVLLVVAFHARLPLFGNGFVGVDVFFVVSGFLITGLLVGEYGERDEIRLGRFYTRRIRRLLPASSLTALGTLALTLLALPRDTWSAIGRSALAAALYVSNLFFGAELTSKTRAEIEPAPLEHFWSLAVEEQFYLVWPLVVLGLCRATSSALRQRGLLAGIGAITIASFAHSVLLVEAGSVWGYYSPLSRAWEFGAGALLAVVFPLGVRGLGDAARQLIAISGLVLVGSSLLTADPGSFPGLGALPVVLGTAAVLFAAVDDQSPLGFVAGLAPVQWLGNLSYSWYLWHWPLLVIGQRAIGSESIAVRGLLVLVSLLIAEASYRFVENPIRHHPALVASLRSNVLLAIGLASIGGLAALAVSALA